jgi:hypothetical protein
LRFARTRVPRQYRKFTRLKSDRRQCVLIERRQESPQRVIKDAFQPAAFRNDALVSGRKTFDECEVRFSRPDDISNSDFLGRLSKANSAGAASHSL